MMYVRSEAFRCLVVGGLVLGTACSSDSGPGADLGGAAATISTGGTPGTTGGSVSGTGGLIAGTGGSTALTGGVLAATGGAPATTGGAASGSGGDASGTGGSGSSSGTGGSSTANSGTTSCGFPAVTDFAAPGPFNDVQMFASVGPNSNYTLFRPTTSLGRDGAKHPIAIWGNGISTTPDQYQGLLGHIASHGFVILACNDTSAERPCLNDGMDWLVTQNDSGEMAGKLDVSKEITIGYSWGGGAAIDTANRPNVKTTVSIHGMPPRETNAFPDMHAPLLLFTATGDTFVSADQYVTPNYDSSVVTTFYATLDEAAGHLYPLDDASVGCVGGPLFVGANQGPCAAAEKEQAPIVAWLRWWTCDDQSAKVYFFGPDCTLCKSPWISQSKPTGAFD